VDTESRGFQKVVMAMELFGSGGVILLVLALVLFGANKLPEMARSLGRAQGEFRKGLREGQIEEEGADDARASGDASA
jgi:sec-independent protein translocase protein TatA